MRLCLEEATALHGGSESSTVQLAKRDDDHRLAVGAWLQIGLSSRAFSADLRLEIRDAIISVMFDLAGGTPGQVDCLDSGWQASDIK